MKMVFYGTACAGACLCFFLLPANAFAENFKLPYAAGQSFVVTQGYHSLPTHVGNDGYALDLTQNGCDAYGKSAVASVSGRVMSALEEGYNGGYGTEALVVSDGGFVERYAHLIPGTIDIAKNDYVSQGETLGRIGNTGLVAGAACPAHPGTHIHFAVDRVMSDGSYSAYDAEPVSGYVGITEGRWYLSDNAPGSGSAEGAVGTTSATLASSIAATSTPSDDAPPCPP